MMSRYIIIYADLLSLLLLVSQQRHASQAHSVATNEINCTIALSHRGKSQAHTFNVGARHIVHQAMLYRFLCMLNDAYLSVQTAAVACSGRTIVKLPCCCSAHACCLSRCAGYLWVNREAVACGFGVLFALARSGLWQVGRRQRVAVRNRISSRR